MKKKLLITFDYELFLGSRSGNIQSCLITPTNKILKVINENKIKGIFFIDTCYLLKLREYAAEFNLCKNDFEDVVNQIKEIVRQGHYVFPHIHPHWIDAVYLPERNEWKLNNIKKYRFHEISVEEREKVFSESYFILKEVIGEVDKNYVVDTYRAGGWCIQPFTDFKPLFEKFNFKIDSSVLSGCYYFSTAQQFDYSVIPDKPIYYFNADVTVEDISGPFIQLTNSTISISKTVRFWDTMFLRLLYYVKGDESFTRGSGQKPELLKDKKPVSEKGTFFDNEQIEYVSAERLSFVKLPSYLRYFEKNDYMHFVSHPKMIVDHNIKILSKFLKIVRSKYDFETDFRKMIG